MKLRNGKIIPYIDFNMKSDTRVKYRCEICMDFYKSKDIIVSCNKNNIKKHNFHESCFNYHKTVLIDKNILYCPYCLLNIKRCYKTKYSLL